MKNLKNKKGFTIVELVIVIAVIAILAAVLIPTFGNVIANANESAAMQEARNAYVQYVEEFADDANVTLVDDLYVKLSDGTTYVEIENGQVVKNNDKYATTLPEDYDGTVINSDGTVVTSTPAA